MNLKSLPFSLVDVFAAEPLSGNGLSVFLVGEQLPDLVMQQITREMRQFETIFLQATAQDRRFCARIFTMHEELRFAGHPIIGAAALLHARLFTEEPEIELDFIVADRNISTISRRNGSDYWAEMDQGVATIGPPISSAQKKPILQALNLFEVDLARDLPLQVVSTGLPYLIVPIAGNLESARIVAEGFEDLLSSVGAKFVYVLDVRRVEGRSWDNGGRVEDIATGSAAGPAAAYLVEHGLASLDKALTISQGRFVGRPSELNVVVRGSAAAPTVRVSGQVCFAGSGYLQLPDRLARADSRGLAVR